MLVKVGVKFFKAFNDVVDEVRIIFYLLFTYYQIRTLHEVIMMFKLF